MAAGPRIVDLSPFLADDSNLEIVAAELDQSFHEIGAAYLVGHGVDLNLVDKVFQTTKDFFKLPKEIKKKYAKANARGDFNGYQDIGEESLDNEPGSSFEMKECYDLEVPNPVFPEEAPEFETTSREFWDAMDNLTKIIYKLLKGILKVDEEFLIDSSYFSGDASEHTIFRVLKYPRVPEGYVFEKGTVRCAEHFDWEIITFIIQDSVGGLDMKTPDGQWIQASPVPNSIICLVGEILEVWTKGYYPAVPHRIPLTEDDERRKQDRYSVAYFVAPNDDFVVKPLEGSRFNKTDYSFTPKTYKAMYEDHVAKSRAY
ncbi:unnamed protein product [Allacma fusca]|uniref:Fe2OG dioxygenase domain-containing protein n=1 Tax=Allacma fusca TaxID=39272 RepID=A0A8J2LDZ1_9HEXA|nr:unnamed protein product [Allacma fusca]